MIYSEARFFVMVLRCSELEASAPRLQSSKSELQSRGDPRNFTAKLKPRPRGLERYSLCIYIYNILIINNIIFLIRLENSSTYQIYVDIYIYTLYTTYEIIINIDRHPWIMDLIKVLS